MISTLIPTSSWHRPRRVDTMIHLEVRLAAQAVARIAVLIGFAAMLICKSMSIAQAQDAATPFMSSYETEDLGAGLYAFRAGVERSFFLVSEEGVVVIDPLNVEAAQALKKEITRITDQPVRYVAYSNSFFERSSGGQIFKDDGAQFVAQEKCAENLLATPRTDVVMPDITFGDSHRIVLGDQTLEFHYFGPSYGNCFTVMVARPANVMLLSNIVSPPKASLPSDPTLANYSLHTLLAFFAAVEDFAAQSEVERVAGGHVSIDRGGDGTFVVLPATAPILLIAEQRAFWETLLGAVKAQYDRGVMAQVIPKRVDMDQFAEYAGYDKRSLQIMTRRVYSLYRIGR
jgi:hypothetical protein